MKKYIKSKLLLILMLILIFSVAFKNISYAKYAITKKISAIKITIHIEQEESGE